MARYLVTGATGFVGHRLAEALLARGDHVRCLVRDPERAAWLRELGAELVAGDVTQPASLRGVAEGVGVVYHLAARGIAPAPVVEATNIGGTRDLLRESQAAGVTAFVYTSSGTVYGDQRGAWVDEGSPVHPSFAYPRSKLEAERLLLEARAGSGFPCHIARVAAVYGEGSPMLMAERVRRGRMRLINGGRNYGSWIHVDDLVRVLLLLPERGKVGRIYVVGDDHPAQLREFYAFIAERLGASPPGSMPLSLAKAVFGLAGLVARLNGREARMPPDLLKMMTLSHRLNNRRMKEDLGIELRYPTFREGLAEVLR